ncbi:MAG TPA: PqqD family protein [Gaiellaceae bacterium]|jgi:hypothetical protein
MPLLPENARFRIAADRAVARVIDGDAIVIDTLTGRYYSLEGTSQVAWTLLASAVPLSTIAAELRERFETGDTDVLGDVSRLAAELVGEKLLVEAGEAEGNEPAVPSDDAPRSPYAPLAMTVFRDMEDLLAFDPPLPVADVSVWTAGSGPAGTT